jgi:uncharacterized membrane protein required for colicin V production
MSFKVLADMTVLLHLGWVLFLAFGALWGRRNRLLKALHVGGLVFAVIMQLMHWYCPLTHLEFWLRSRHDPALAYPGSFLSHYAEEIIYVELSWEAILAATVVLCAVNAWLYLRRPRDRRRPAP